MELKVYIAEGRFILCADVLELIAGRHYTFKFCMSTHVYVVFLHFCILRYLVNHHNSSGIRMS